MTTTKITTTGSDKPLARSTVTPRPKAPAKKATTAKKAPAKKATPAKAAAPKVDPNATPTLAATRVERLARAKVEAKTLKAWADHGENVTRPLTPNLDALEAGEPTTEKATSKKASVRSTRNPRYNEALERKRQGPRGKGKPVTDADLIKHIEAVRAERTDTTMQQECEIAYWLHGLSVTWRRFGPVWDHVVNGKPMPEPKATKATGSKSKDTAKAAA